MMKNYCAPYKSNGEIDWLTFSANQSLHKGKAVYVKNDDFIHGTVIIKESCAIIFAEDIVFDPLYFDPKLSVNASLYTDPAYRLGFFAAIVVAAKDVVINMQKHSISQSKKHYLLQRFYSHIELADSPFIPHQGPAAFTTHITAAENVVIYNGTLGLTSHHGIHGNNAKSINIKHLEIYAFEVAAIALNGSSNVLIEHVNIDGTLNVPVLGSFSAAVFMKQFIDNVLEYVSLPEAKEELTKHSIVLGDAINAVVTDVMTTGSVDPNRESTKIFINDTEVPDGTSYGIVFNGHGVAVDGFMPEAPEVFVTKNITINEVHIKHMVVSTHEIIAISNGKERKPQVDVAGAVFQIELVDDGGVYKGNILADAQISLARWSNMKCEGFDPTLYALKSNKKLGTLSIHPAIIAWARSDCTYVSDDESCKVTQETPLPEVMACASISYIGNGDTMFHVNKGVIGIRCDGVDTCVIRSTIIYDVINKSPPGSEKPGPYKGSEDGGHFKQSPLMIGYTGADAYGIVLSCCKNVGMKKCDISKVSTESGSAWGVKIMGKSEKCNTLCSRVSHIHCGDPVTLSDPNKEQRAVCYYIGKGCKKCYIKNTDIEEQDDQNNDGIVISGSHNYVFDA